MKVNRIVSLLIMVGLAVGLGVWRMRARQDRDPRRPTQKNSSVPSAPALDPAALDAPPPAAGQTGDGVARLSGQPAGTLGLSLENEVHAALQRGLDWLAERQRDDGSWSNPNFPAITALATEAFIRSRHPRKDEVVRKGIAFILSCARDDGGIYRPVEGRKGGGLGNYNTAICMTTLHAAGNPELTPYVLNARTYIAGSQHFGDDVYKGGFGYDRQTDRAYADLLNTYYAAVAMRETADAEEARPAGEKRVDIDWSQTVKFVERMQNRPEAGKESYGGFFYKPGESKAGTTTNETGTVYFRSYGSMTYAGLLALIYADVDREDVRVRSAFDWASRHWTLEENPGMGAQGLFYFYNVLTKSLSALGADAVPHDGKPVNWREEIAKKMVETQTIDPQTGHGYWENKSGRFWESDSVLVTAYGLLTLHMLL